MKPSLALLITIFGILYLFKRDLRQQSNVSYALWIPWLWIMIIGTRPLSLWLNLGAPIEITTDMHEEGSPVDRMGFLVLIASGFYFLWKRRISCSLLFKNNISLTLFLCYCTISIIWSEFPFIAFKRLIKVLGHPLMALLLLTEPSPVKAIETVLKRCAYVCIPLSVLFIKYYPELGRAYSRWEYKPILVGITNDKNALGYISIVFGLFFVCKLISLFNKNNDPENMIEKIINLSLFSMTCWLLILSNSKTSLVCFILSIIVVLSLSLTSVKKHLVFYICISVYFFIMLQIIFNITEAAITGLGRNATLTGRDQLWSDVLQMNPNILIGTGFESFWLGKRLEILWEKYWWQPNQSHNGYIETYINLGWLGLFFLSTTIISIFRNIQNRLLYSFILRGPEISHFYFERFCMGFLISLLIYNITEAVFKSTHFLFLIFFIIAIKYPQVKPETGE